MLFNDVFAIAHLMKGRGAVPWSYCRQCWQMLKMLNMFDKINVMITLLSYLVIIPCSYSCFTLKDINKCWNFLSLYQILQYWYTVESGINTGNFSVRVCGSCPWEDTPMYCHFHLLHQTHKCKSKYWPFTASPFIFSVLATSTVLTPPSRALPCLSLALQYW